MTEETDHEAIFDARMQGFGWGGKESLSGRGSDLDQTDFISSNLSDLLRQLGVKSVLDLPCGDFHWMKFVDLSGIDYEGGDVSSDLIRLNERAFARKNRRFRTLNIMTDELPSVDLVFSRDVLVHFSFADIGKSLSNLVRGGSKYFMTTTFPGRESNVDIATGAWRPLNLEEAPFHFPRPLLYLVERCTEGNGMFRDKSLGVWEIESLKPLVSGNRLRVAAT